jgi:hypothetical protein
MVLYDIGNKYLGTNETRFAHRLIEDSAGGPDKRMALDVFFVAWLFAHQHGAGALRSLA